MTRRNFGLAWIAVGLVVVVAFGWIGQATISLFVRGRQASVDIAKLTSSIEGVKAAMRAQLQSQGSLIKDLRWSPDRSNPAVFLGVLSDLARGPRMKIIGIGPLERQNTAQFVKAWHTLQIIGPFLEVRDVMANIEHEGAILQDVTVERRRETGPTSPAHDEIQAHMRMSTMALTPDAKRVLAQLGGPQRADDRPAAPVAAVTLPLPRGPVGARDAFAFAEPRTPGLSEAATKAAPAVRARASALREPSTRTADASASVDVKGIVEFSGGHLAIVNDQIVKEGDAVNSLRVLRITDSAVVLRAVNGETQQVRLRSLHPVAEKK